jgi:hypothetical protein
MVDSFWSNEFHARSLLYSLQAGDLYRITLALVTEVGINSVWGGRNRRRAQTLLDKATILAERTGNPYAIGLATMYSGVSAYLQGEWIECRRRMDSAEATLRKHCTGVAWELATMRFQSSVSSFYELKPLCEGLPAFLQDANARDDRSTNMRL